MEQAQQTGEGALDKDADQEPRGPNQRGIGPEQSLAHEFYHVDLYQIKNWGGEGSDQQSSVIPLQKQIESCGLHIHRFAALLQPR